MNIFKRKWICHDPNKIIDPRKEDFSDLGLVVVIQEEELEKIVPIAELKQEKQTISP